MDDGAEGNRQTRKRIALFVDWNNFSGRCRERGLAVDPILLKHRVMEYGDLVWATVFVNVRELHSAVGRTIQIAGLKINHVEPILRSDGSQKDVVDPHLIDDMIDAVDAIQADVFVLATFDCDFVPVINRLQTRHRKIVRLLLPTEDDVPALLECVKGRGIIAYRSPDKALSPLERAVKSFARGVYGSASSDVQEELDRFGAVVCTLVSIGINRRFYGFNTILDKLGRQQKFASRFPEDSVRSYLQILIKERVVIKKEMDSQKEKERTNGRVSRPHRYVVNMQHGFVITALKNRDAAALAEVPDHA